MEREVERVGSIEEVSLFFVSAENLRARRSCELDPLFSAGHHFLDLFYSQTEFSHVHLRWIGLNDNDFVVDSSKHEGLVNRILSGFLPLVTQYAEFDFIDKLFPDVQLEDISSCIDRYLRSERRFGV